MRIEVKDKDGRINNPAYLFSSAQSNVLALSVFLTSACLGKNSLKKEYADKLCKELNLSDEVSIALQEYPNKTWDFTIPQDPVVYRFYEVVGVYGDTIKEIIGEKFGDGIMSAIDFSMDIEKEENPAGDRVKITMNGKFLPYKSW